MTSVSLDRSRSKELDVDPDPVCSPCRERTHEQHSGWYLDGGGVEQICACLCVMPDEDLIDFLDRVDGELPDEDLYDFVARHESSPCPQCPADSAGITS